MKSDVVAISPALPLHTDNDAPQSRQARFLALYEPVRPNIERFVRAMARRWNDDPETSKDLLSETIAAAYQRIDELRNPQAFLSFVFTIATRLHRKQRASEARITAFSHVERKDGADAEARYEEAFKVDAHQSQDEYDVTLLYAALDKLPAKQRESVIMFEILGFSMKEIQAVQGGTLVAVKVRVARGRAALTRMLSGKR
jgi:RNA polymerase sigma-70 factor (ECF subfamily)